MDIHPYAALDKPYYHVENIGLKHPANRPQGQVHIKRVFQFPQGNAEFNYIAKRSALQALKTLDDKPNMAAEITYKLRADANNGILVKLSEFLKLPEVIEAGITLEEARKQITPAPIHMVSNINSKSSPVRMVIAPHQPHKVTKQSINDALHAGHHGLPSIQDTILRFRLSVSIALVDLSCSHKGSIIDPLGSLKSAIWLQGEEGSPYPFLDPTRRNKLELWVFRSQNIGFKEASSLAAAGKK